MTVATAQRKSLRRRGGVQVKFEPVDSPVKKRKEHPQITIDSSDRSSGSLVCDSSFTSGSSFKSDSSIKSDSSYTSDFMNTEPGSNHRDVNKYLVYEDCLLSLFQNCPLCTCACVVKKVVRGTYLSVHQNCPNCGYSHQWNSQPLVGNIPAGDLQLSAAISFTGSSFAQVDKVLTALKVKSIDKATHQSHVRNYLDPCIHSTWQSIQSDLLQTMTSKDVVNLRGDLKDNVVANYNSYTVRDTETDNIIDIQLVQSEDGEVGHSNRVEMEGLVRSLDFLESSGVKIDTLTTNRNQQINKYLKENKPEVTHCYDVRHIAKDVSQELVELGKKEGCEMIQKWQQSIISHLYWSRHLSPSGDFTVAKWSSLLNHMHNVHDHPNSLFPKCLHPPVMGHSKKWLKSGTKPSIKLQQILQNKRLLEDLANLSPLRQTSDTEGFNSLIQLFAPQKETFNFRGLQCRLYLAAMHHNENNRQQRVQNEGEHLCQIWPPKYKKRKRTQAKKQQTLNYVQILMDVLFEDVLADPGQYTANLHALPIPQAVNVDEKHMHPTALDTKPCEPRDIVVSASVAQLLGRRFPVVHLMKLEENNYLECLL